MTTVNDCDMGLKLRKLGGEQRYKLSVKNTQESCRMILGWSERNVFFWEDGWYSQVVFRGWSLFRVERRMHLEFSRDQSPSFSQVSSWAVESRGDTEEAVVHLILLKGKGASCKVCQTEMMNSDQRKGKIERRA